MANLGIWLLLGLFIAIGGLAGVDIIEWNDEYVHGLGAVGAAAVLAVIFAILGTVFFVIGALVIKGLSRWLPLGKIEIRAPADAGDQVSS